MISCDNYTGRLSSVKNLTATIMMANASMYIDWTPPFSLEIENHIITYCVCIYNTSSQALQLSVCDLAETHFTYSYHNLEPTPCDSFDIIVFPVNRAGNGSNNQVTQTFYNSKPTSDTH